MAAPGKLHILSVLVENKAGVLTRIAGLFARRGAPAEGKAGEADRPAANG